MFCIGKNSIYGSEGHLVLLMVSGIQWGSWIISPLDKGELLNFLTKLKVKRHIPRIKQN